MKLIRFLYIYTFAFSLFYFVYVYSIEFALWHDSKKGGCPDLRRLVVGVATSVSTHYSLKQYYVKCFIFKLYPYISGSNFHSALSPDSSFALYSLLSWSPVYCCLVKYEKGGWGWWEDKVVVCEYARSMRPSAKGVGLSPSVYISVTTYNHPECTPSALLDPPLL